MSVDMASFTAPRSDQMNYDDLIGGPRTITITGVRANEGSKEQPVSIAYAGDEGKPYKPCLSMRRVLVHLWGADAKNYIGRSLTLYGDPKVQWGGMEVGGIRISHASHIEAPQTMALTATRARRAAFTVQPLRVVDVPALVAQFEAAQDQAAVDAAETARAAVWKALGKSDQRTLKAASDAAKTRITTATEPAK